MQTENCFIYSDKPLIAFLHCFSKCWYFRKYHCSHLIQVNLCGNCTFCCCAELFYLFPGILQVLCQYLILDHQILNVLSRCSCKGQLGFGNGIWILPSVCHYHPFSNECRQCMIIQKIISPCLYNSLLKLIIWQILHIHYRIIIKGKYVPFLARGQLNGWRQWRLNNDLWCTKNQINIFILRLRSQLHVRNLNEIFDRLSKLLVLHLFTLSLYCWLVVFLFFHLNRHCFFSDCTFPFFFFLLLLLLLFFVYSTPFLFRYQSFLHKYWIHFHLTTLFPLCTICNLSLSLFLQQVVSFCC